MARLIQSLDLAKFIGALLIVAMHCHPFISYPGLDYWFTALCRVAVPFFFITSSYLFFSSGKSIWDFVKRLLILYLCWFIIELPLTVYRFFIDTEESFFYNCFLFFRGLFVNSTFQASWFITALWQGTLIVWWLSRKIGRKGLVIVGVLCFVVACAWSMYRNLLTGLPGWHAFKIFGILLAPSNSFIVAVQYIVAGKLIAEGAERKVNRKTLGLVCTGAVMVWLGEIFLCRNICYMSDAYLSLILICPLLFVALLRTEMNLSPDVSKFLRNSSILIYLLHLPLSYIFVKVGLLTGEGLSMTLLVMLVSVCLAFTIVALSKKWPKMKYLF